MKTNLAVGVRSPRSPALHGAARVAAAPVGICPIRRMQTCSAPAAMA